jgi:hypothetical protein
VGVDTNPLNEPGEPVRDFTATLVPGVDSTLRIGRGRLTGKTSLEYVHFNQTRSQRSANVNQEARAELLLNRITPYAVGTYLRTRQRPTPEIDQRVQQNSTSGGFGTGLRLGARLRMDIEGRRSRIRFGEGKHGVQEIAEALDRNVDLGSVAARFTLSPLTTFVLRTEVQRDRFRVSTERDANSISVLPGFEFKPRALIAGRVFVGFRRFDMLDEGLPDFAGVVGRIDAQYVWRESTLFALFAERNPEYSIASTEPYYILNAGTVSATQSIGLNWYAIGRVGESRLNYREFLPTLTDSRVDRVFTRGFGFGRRLGRDIRIGFDIDYVRRRSTIALNEYEGYRVGGSFSYGS